MRASVYALLGNLLETPPSVSTLRALGRLEGDQSAFGTALSALASAAREANAEALRAEYQALFIGIPRGELLPYASYYLTGALNEWPLAELRRDMAELGIARSDEVREPEDHIAALCEMMCGLITGAFGGPHDLATQRRFFGRHLAPWAPAFFEDLEAAESAALYGPLGRVGLLFMEIERKAFEMPA